MPISVPLYIDKLKEYDVSTQDVWKVEDNSGILKLDWNESQYFDDYLKKIISKNINQCNGLFNWYPDVASHKLKTKLSEHYNINYHEILTFGGSDSALETITRTFLQDDDEVLIINPGYDNFRIYVESCNAKYIKYTYGIESTNFNLANMAEIVSSCSHLKLIYLINPNNPIGYRFSKNEIIEILDKFKDVGVIIDEAYTDFAGDGQSTMHLVDKYDNLIVVRSFSKSFAIAGLRSGYIISQKQNIRNINKLRNGKNVSMISQIASITLLDHVEITNNHIKKIIIARDWFIKRYREIGGKCFDSHTNFVLLKLINAEEVVNSLKYNGIFIRNRSNIEGLEETARITIGYKDDMKKIIDIFENKISVEYWK